MKKCPNCKQNKSLSQFYVNRGTISGRSSWCADCIKTLSRNSHWRRYHARYKREYQKKAVDKIKARSLLRTALIGSKLKKGKCFLCGSNKNIHGHHLSYEHPLKVIWLCSTHHNKFHNG